MKNQVGYYLALAGQLSLYLEMPVQVVIFNFLLWSVKRVTEVTGPRALGFEQLTSRQVLTRFFPKSLERIVSL